MKGSFFGLRCKELSLILIVLVCSTILIWTWDRTPLLTSFLPPKSRLLQLSPEIQVGAPLAPSVSSEPQIHVSKEISAFTEKETENDQEQNKDVFVSVTDEEANQKQIPEAEQNGNAESSTSTTEVEGEKLILGGKDSKQEEQSKDTVVPTGSTNTSPSVRGENDRNMTTRMENKDVLLSVTEEEANHKQIQQAEENGNAESSTSTTEVEGEKLILGGKDSKQEEQSIDTIVPMGSTYTGSSVRGENDRNMTTRMENQACNYAKGKWVVDENRSLYSGFGCKQWLSQMWACRLMQRKDFAYEKLRWQPKDCQMEEFDQSKFFKRMQDKTLAFVGDSLGRQQFQSLMCMITGGEERHDVINVGKEYGLVKPRGAIRPSGWAYLFPSTNTTVLYYWSASLCDLEPLNVTNPATDYAMHLDRPPAFLRRYLHKFDVLVLNTGHHWNRGKLRANRWVMYVGGVRNTNMKIAQIGGAKNLTVHSIVNWVNSQLPKHPRLKAFYRSISPRHFVNGDWNTGGSCDNTTPMSIGKEVLQDKSSDYSAASAVKGTGVKLLDITAVSQMRDEGHISRYSLTASKGVQDCLHWCLPGVPDTWNEILFAQI